MREATRMTNGHGVPGGVSEFLPVLRYSELILIALNMSIHYYIFSLFENPCSMVCMDCERFSFNKEAGFRITSNPIKCMTETV